MTYKIGIYDHATGEQSTREMTAEEVADYEAAISEKALAKAAKEAELKAAKEALLSSLGISEEQAIVLGLIKPAFVAREIASSEAKTI